MSASGENKRSRPNSHSRSQVEKVAAARVSLFSNLLLTAIKTVIGLLSGSVSVLSEAAHSTTDLLASGLALFAVGMADRAPDEEHPYGHGKVESLFSLAEALLLFAVAGYIIYDAVDLLRTHGRPRRLEWGMAVMAVSAVVNVVVVRYMLRVAERTDSQAVRADAENHRTDIYTALGVLIGLFLVRVTGYSFFDPILAIGVSLMVLRAAWRLTLWAFAPLMDRNLPPDEIAIVRRVFDSEASVLGYHKLRTRKSGSVRHVDAHVQMDDQLTLLEAHGLTERLEDRIREELPNSEVTLHTEPYQEEKRHQQREHGDPS